MLVRPSCSARNLPEVKAVAWNEKQQVESFIEKGSNIDRYREGTVVEWSWALLYKERKQN